jgi:5-methyltetrahydropteroyltriglutamate--homocysteine methyltransferase
LNISDLDAYLWIREVISTLKAEGATWIQLDEPALVLDLEPCHLEAFEKAYNTLGALVSGIKILVGTYFADITVESYK